MPVARPEQTDRTRDVTDAGPHRSLAPLAARVEARGDGWSVRLPVRAEEVIVEKLAFVYEEVQLRREERVETARHQETVRRETPRIDEESLPTHAQPTRPIDPLTHG